MRSLLLGALAPLLGCGASPSSTAEDNDYDGFLANEDCDDTNPWVHPGAPEEPGDGVDANCDGEDGEHPFAGTWALTFISAGFSGFEILLPDQESGELTIASDLQTDLFIHAEVDPSVAPLVLDLELNGEAVTDSSPGSFTLVAAGDWGSEEVNVGWACSSDELEMTCEGGLKMLGYSFDSVADFEAVP